jgi:hypothetical protein
MWGTASLVGGLVGGCIGALVGVSVLPQARAFCHGFTYVFLFILTRRTAMNQVEMIVGMASRVIDLVDGLAADSVLRAVAGTVVSVTRCMLPSLSRRHV